MRHLFICGPARSGTTAVVRALNHDARFVIGYERFLKHESGLPRPEDFAPDVFFAPRTKRRPDDPTTPPPDVFPPVVSVERLRRRYEQGGVAYIGDKVPSYFRHLPELADAFPDARFLMTVRPPEGVANSFHGRATDPDDGWPAKNDWERAMRDWNAALALGREFEDGYGADRLHLLDYDGFLAGRKAHVLALYRFLGLEPDMRLVRVLRRAWGQYPRRDTVLTPEMVAEIQNRRDRGLARWARRRVAASLTA